MCLARLVQALIIATACTAQSPGLQNPMREVRTPPGDRPSRPLRNPRPRTRMQMAPMPQPAAQGPQTMPPSITIPPEAIDTPVATPDAPIPLTVAASPPPDDAQPVQPPSTRALPAIPPPPAPAPVPPTLPPPVPATDPEEGDLRLLDQVDVNGYVTGALQVFLDGDFGTVCTAGFRDADAQVACRQLGFVGGGFLQFARPSPGLTDAQLQELQAPVLLESPECTGAEARLLDCPLGDYVSPYKEYRFYYVAGTCAPSRGNFNAYIACGTVAGPADGDLRLTGGPVSDDGRSVFGRLEVFNEGGWGTACSRRGFIRRFRPADAQVACRSLGFSAGFVIEPMEAEEDDLPRLPVWLSGAGCAGTENTLLECPEMSLGLAGFCGITDTVRLSCSSGADPDLDGRLRLMEGGSGPDFQYGRLEVFIRGFWSSVCDKNGFTPDAAQVACRQLGFDGGAAVQFIQPLQRRENEVLVSEIPPGLSGLDCNGSEASLLDCTTGDIITGECSVFASAATDATVLACGNTSADCGEPAMAAQGDVRLRGGFGTPCDSLYTGFIEVFNAGEWGAICDGESSRTRDFLVADVVCRQLGFPHGTVVDSLTTRPDLPYDYYFADVLSEEAQEPQARFWLGGVQCRGPERRLVECDLGEGFIDAPDGGLASCSEQQPASRLHVACRQFAIPEALEAMVL